MSVNQVKLLNYNATKTVLDKCELRDQLREGMSKKKNEETIKTI